MSAALHPPGDALHVVLLDIDGTLIDSNDIGMGGDKLLPTLVGLDAESGEATRIGETRG